MKKILIVDDEEILLIALERILDEAGYSVLKTTDGKEAITIAKRKHPDLILLDIKMPGMDGDKVTDALRNDQDTFDIPIIYQTGLVREQQVDCGHVTGSKIGNMCFIAKPYNKDKILETISKFI